MHHALPLKTRLVIGGAVVVIGWTGSYFYIRHGLAKIKAEGKQELENMDRARKIIIEKFVRGDYDGQTTHDIMADYEFYKMAGRLIDE